jgi:hypothetical protein
VVQDAVTAGSSSSCCVQLAAGVLTAPATAAAVLGFSSGAHAADAASDRGYVATGDRIAGC